MHTWRPVPGYEGMYCVSSGGLVKSIARRRIGRSGSVVAVNDRILRPSERRGYLSVSLWKDGSGKTHAVHRLVAYAFIDNPLSLPEVNHLDGVRSNNVVSNLEWCTRHENLAHAVKRGLGRASANPNRAKKLTASGVSEIRLLRAQGKSYCSIAKTFGLTRETCRKICLHILWP